MPLQLVNMVWSWLLSIAWVDCLEIIFISVSSDQMAMFGGFYGEHALGFGETDHSVAFILQNCVS